MPIYRNEDLFLGPEQIFDPALVATARVYVCFEKSGLIY
jgi:hypothetical protein